MPLEVASGDNDPYAKKQTVQIDIETIRLHTLSLAARLQSRISIDTIRPLPMFLGIPKNRGSSSSGGGGNSSNICPAGNAFSSPVHKLDKSTLEKIKARVKINTAFFLSNYALVAAMVATVIALMHPGMLFFVGLLYGGWMLHKTMIRHEIVVFGISLHNILTIQQRFYVLFILTVVVIVWKCLMPSLRFFFISSFLITSHAFLRDPKHIDSSSSSSGMHTDSDEEEDDEEGGGGGSQGHSGGSSDSEVLVERVPIERPRKRGDVI